MSNVFDEIRKVIGRKPIHESVEETTSTGQIDELSKKTLGSYIKKAKSDYASRAYGGKEYSKGNEDNYFRKVDNRKSGLNKAKIKFTKEEIEILESLLIKAGLEDLFAESHRYEVHLHGGSIGEIGKNKTASYSSENEQEAHEVAKRRNKTLSTGDKKYYGLKYKVHKVLKKDSE